jgi:BolA family transcriptional regulator, general stress-responsive regulator
VSSALTEEIRAALERALTPAHLEIVDDSARHAGHGAPGAHFKVTLIAAAFRGHSQLERHRLVYAALAPLLAQAVHALNISARTPEEAQH